MNAPTRLADQPLANGAAPPWASEWGEDRYGIFVGFSVGGVTQIMRWIRPGSFMMGSPETEPERFGDEGPQHRVTFSEGFWLADTACTQELWKAVMGDEPSRFKGSRRPVETVSWKDVQGFIERANALVPGLALCLPSEALWEYACRAGTMTPFSLGQQVDPSRVNYDGNFPYNGGGRGLYREETVEVRAFPPNRWGLHEMHGNVWEWCEDHQHGNYIGAPSDGSAWLDKAAEGGAGRVLRGGSWDARAGSCRSADRHWVGPDAHDGGIGFRCARVQV